MKLQLYKCWFRIVFPQQISTSVAKKLDVQKPNLQNTTHLFRNKIVDTTSMFLAMLAVLGSKRRLEMAMLVQIKIVQLG